MGEVGVEGACVVKVGVGGGYGCGEVFCCGEGAAVAVDGWGAVAVHRCSVVPA